MIVVDASVLTQALAFADDRGRRARAGLAKDPQWAAPQHLVVETLSALRGLSLGGHLTPEDGEEALARLRRLTVDLVDVRDLLDEMWRLRHTVTGYDAAYVALARRRDLTLVTGDLRLAAAASARCRVEAVE